MVANRADVSRETFFLLDVAAAVYATTAKRICVISVSHRGRVSHHACDGVLQFELIDTTLQCRDFVLCKAVENLLRLRRDVRIDNRSGLVDVRVRIRDCKSVLTTLLPRRLFILRFL